jgi:hypothetical protein
MLSFDESLLQLVWHSVFASTIHIAFHDLKDRIREYRHRPEALRNTDVRKAIDSAVRVVAKKLRAAYRTAHPEDRNGHAQLGALSKLNLTASMDSDERETASLLSAADVTELTARHVERALSHAPERARVFAKERFAPLFVFAFREIGLKSNEKVRTVVFESLLQRLGQTERNLRARLEDTEVELRIRLQALGFEIASINEAISGLAEELRKEPQVVFDRSRLGDGPVVGYVRIEDAEGNLIQTDEVRSRKFTIGRAGANDVAIRLTDSRVSRRHAEVVLESDGVVVRDLHSKHGTFAGDRRLQGLSRIALGTSITIGEFQVRFFGLDAAAEQLMAPTTK